MIQRFNLAHCAFWASLGLIILTVSDGSLWSRHDNVRFLLQITMCLTAALRALSCLLVPRRPDVYHQGRIVDQEHTASLWTRFTFGHITSFILYIGRNPSIDMNQFPQLPFQARSDNLHNTLRHAQAHGRSLFRAMCTVHRRVLILQISLALASGLLSFGPQVVLYGVLTVLENHSIGDPLVWAAVLGIPMCLSSSLTSWLWWITYSQMAIPVYSELLALLYAKIMRRKVVHQSKEAVDGMDRPSEHPETQGQQEIINLATVDTKRISDYCSYYHLIPSSIIQFFVAFVFLLHLIGWESLLAGLAANLVASPLNLFVAKEYNSFQHRMMRAKDQRTAMVHEVIKNIRQVKFSALEPAWQHQILEARRHEMRLTLRGCFYETIFQGMWTLTPLLLSAVSLTVYALKNDHLEASVAFTSISIFGTLDLALAALPHLLSTALEARISVNRIENFTRAPEKKQSRSNESDIIVFQDACIAWPTSENTEGGNFHLSSLNFKIPRTGLTVVTGRTGSGKTLILSAILGESEVMSGSVQVPLRGQEMWNSASTSGGQWIIDTAIAYVAQNPWTEDGTIKDNILLGLPFDRNRYQQVLFAAGLERDLDILPDGDQTDIGANGVNLSGGQRLRISFARALYSRAGILVMDDIFSALDADTSNHVYEYGLTGSLAANRTRILATHHNSICLPRTDYCIVLAEEATSYAGTIEQLRKMDVLKELSAQEDKNDDKKKSLDQLAGSNEQNLSYDRQEGKKFSEEEQRATGPVPLKVYRKFVTDEKYPWMWALGVLVSLLYIVFVVGRVSRCPLIHPCNC